MSEIQMPNVRTVRLEKLRFGVQQHITGAMIDASADMDWDPWLSSLVIRLQGAHLGERFQEKRIVYPEDWWQAFKERWAPKWFKKRWPVRYKAVKWSAWALYPELKVKIPGERVDIAITEERKVTAQPETWL